jgi:hypothetical protein
MKKPLPDLDQGHPFYGPKAEKNHRELVKKLEQAEKQMVEDNRKHYKNKNKKQEGEIDA